VLGNSNLRFADSRTLACLGCRTLSSAFLLSYPNYPEGKWVGVVHAARAG
jgi:hypothetical protein